MKSKEKSTTEITDALALELEEHADRFEELSLNVLENVSKGYKTQHFQELITFEFDQWGGRNILEIADYVDAVNVIAQDKIQEYIQQEWMGWLDGDTSYFRVIVSIPFPFLALKAFRNPTAMDNKKYIELNEAEIDNTSKKQNFIDGADNLEDRTKLKLSTLEKIKCFYKAPITKFILYMLMYFAFLFTYMVALLLTDKMDPESCLASTMFNFRKMFGCKLSLPESIVYFIVICLIPIEIRQIYFSYPTNLIGKLDMYISSFHNKTDLLSLVFILLALVFKLQTDPTALNHDYLPHHNGFRILFAIAFIFFCIRVTQFFSVDKKLGPKVNLFIKFTKNV